MTSAISWYKVCPCHTKAQDSGGLSGGNIGSTLAEFYSMADYATTGRGIPNRFDGGYWAPLKVGNGIRYISVAS